MAFACVCSQGIGKSPEDSLSVSCAVLCLPSGTAALGCYRKLCIAAPYAQLADTVIPRCGHYRPQPLRNRRQALDDWFRLGAVTRPAIGDQLQARTKRQPAISRMVARLVVVFLLAKSQCPDGGDFLKDAQRAGIDRVCEVFQRIQV